MNCHHQSKPVNEKFSIFVIAIGTVLLASGAAASLLYVKF